MASKLLHRDNFTCSFQKTWSCLCVFTSKCLTGIEYRFFFLKTRHFINSSIWIIKMSQNIQLTLLRSIYLHFFAEILCTDKNRGSKLCRQVESMRQQLEEINTDRQELRKMLREQNSLLEKTNKNIVAISRSLQDVRDSRPKEKVIEQHNFLWSYWE